MAKCASNCEHLREDGLKDYITAESGGYCTKHDKIVWFDFVDECSDYKPKEEQKELKND